MRPCIVAALCVVLLLSACSRVSQSSAPQSQPGDDRRGPSADFSASNSKPAAPYRGRQIPINFPLTNVWDNPSHPDGVYAVTTYIGGQVLIFVRPGDRPRVLHLSSQYPAIWRIFLLPGAQVAKIYISAFQSQRVQIIFPKIGKRPLAPEIVDLGNFRGSTLSLAAPTFFESQDRETAKWIEDYKAEVARLTRSPLASAQGLKALRLGDAMTIPANSPLSETEIASNFDPAEIWKPSGPSAVIDLEDTRRDLRILIKRGEIPARLMPMENPDPVSGPWELVPPDGLLVDDIRDQLELYPSQCSELQMGSPFSDVLKCYADGPDRGARTKWIFAGGGNDIVDDSNEQSQLINGGAGDDTLAVDLGTDVLYFGRNWGHDIVQVRCLFGTDKDYRGGTAFPEGNRYMPAGRNLRYIVFGKGVYPKDLEWKSDTILVNKRTGDSISFNEGICAKMIAVERGRLPASPVWKPDRVETHARDTQTSRKVLLPIINVEAPTGEPRVVE